MMKPLVSVITPVYNQRQYIAETIESVLAQDYPTLEYTVVDDGSTDGTADVIKKYSDRLNLVKHQNMGQYATVNKAFAATRGEIVGIVNSDDPLLEGAISHIVKVFEENPDVVVVYPDWKLIDQDGQVISVATTWDYCYEDMLRFQHCIPGPAAFFRRRIFEELEGRNPEYKFMADFDFWLRAGLKGDFMRCPEVLATFRLHPDSITVSQKNLDMAREHIRLVGNYFERYELPQRVRRYKTEAFSSANYIAGTVAVDNSYLVAAKYFLASLLNFRPRFLKEQIYLSRVKSIVSLLIIQPLRSLCRC